MGVSSSSRPSFSRCYPELWSALAQPRSCYKHSEGARPAALVVDEHEVVAVEGQTRLDGRIVLRLCDARVIIRAGLEWTESESRDLASFGEEQATPALWVQAF